MSNFIHADIASNIDDLVAVIWEEIRSFNEEMDPQQILCETKGIAERSINDCQIPQGDLPIDLNDDLPISIYRLDGSIVFDGFIDSNPFKSLSPGLYIYEIKYGDHTCRDLRMHY